MRCECKELSRTAVFSRSDFPQALLNHEPCLALLVLPVYSNPRNIWQNQVAEASPLHHEEEISMQMVLIPCLLYSESRLPYLENFTFR